MAMKVNKELPSPAELKKAYRLPDTLEKIKKLTGLDLREFDDAIVFKVALMVKKYLSANPAKY